MQTNPTFIAGRHAPNVLAGDKFSLVPTVGLQPQLAATATSASRQLSPAHSTPALHQ